MIYLEVLRRVIVAVIATVVAVRIYNSAHYSIPWTSIRDQSPLGYMYGELLPAAIMAGVVLFCVRPIRD